MPETRRVATVSAVNSYSPLPFRPSPTTLSRVYEKSVQCASSEVNHPKTFLTLLKSKFVLSSVSHNFLSNKFFLTFWSHDS